MSILVIQISPRSRLRSQGPGAVASDAHPNDEIVYALSPDGLVLESQGRCAATLLPKTDSVVAVLSDADVSWHRITLPKTSAARMRAALTGVLEEAILDDMDTTHFAIAPETSAGHQTWIAAVNRSWLRAELAILEKSSVFVDRIVPSAWPDDPPTGHFSEVETDERGTTQTIGLTWSHPDGVACLPLQGGLARAVIRPPLPAGTRWSATPGAAAAAEQWLGQPVNVMQPAQRLLQAARTLWNLRQFDLARRNRGTRAVRDAMRRFLSSEWRPVRLGLITLLVAQIVGLNLWAWHQTSAINARRQAITAVLQNAFPQVRAVLDAPLQMQRELQSLRIQAGKPGETDFEPMMQAAAAAWPANQPPVNNLRYESGKLTLNIAGWGMPQIEEFRNRLQPAGWHVDAADGSATLTRSSVGSAP